MNKLLGSIFNIAILITKSINSSIKTKILKNFFLANYQTIYFILPGINYNNNLLFQYTIVIRSIY